MDQPGTPTLMLNYRDVVSSPSNLSPSTSSEYSLESLESLEQSGAPTSPIDLCEYFKNTSRIASQLNCLSLREQRELYEAAETIQKAYRTYRGRRWALKSESAALTIQTCYRRYRQYLEARNQLSKSRKSLDALDGHHCEAKRFKTSYSETDDEEVDEGMYSHCTTGTNSSDISMANSTAQSDEEEDISSSPIRHAKDDLEDEGTFFGEFFPGDEEVNLNLALKRSIAANGRPLSSKRSHRL